MDTMKYFDSLYEGNDDPWHYQTRWYEARKRQMCLSALPYAHYGHVLELGCGIGVMSVELARRCNRLLCLDGQARAVQLASARLQAASHVEVRQGLIPQDLPDGQYDLIVMSEILYYLQPEQLQQVISWVGRHLQPHGSLLCCHWRYPIDGFALNGNSVHATLQQGLRLDQLVSLNDRDFWLDIWQQGGPGVAEREGLVEI